jgi:hypothetical protein
VLRANLDTRISELALGIAATSPASAPLSLARARFLANPAHAPLVVHDPSGTPIGVFTHAELQACLEADGDQSTEPFIDQRILILPSSASVQRAAREALSSGAHYILASDGPAVYRVLSGSTFTRCVYGGPAERPAPSFAAIPPSAPVIVRDPDFRTGVLASFLESLPAWTGFDTARPPRNETLGSETPSSEPPSAEPPSADQASSGKASAEPPSAELRREEPTRRREPA